MTVYGPYSRRDGRQHVIHVFADGSRQTQSYPRHLMENHLGRKLQDWEEVDHKNDDPSDNRIENFQILTKLENLQKGSHSELYYFNCPICTRLTVIPYRRFRDNQVNKGKSGPYCSKSCAGRA